MAVLIENRQKRHKLRLRKIKTQAKAILGVLECEDCELSLVFVDDIEMANINETYLNRVGPTNVIAFSMREGVFADIAPNLLGDVIISTDTTEKEANDFGSTFDVRLLELIIHGILHLFGYDHEKSETEDKRMRKKSKELFELVENE